MRILIGFDQRQPLSYTVCHSSIIRRASKPVQITPLVLSTLAPFKRRGLTEFTYSRFMVPHQCKYQGFALFLDADMLVLDDIHKIVDLHSPVTAVSMVKNPQGFEWASLMYFCNPMCQKLTPEYVTNSNPFDLEWAPSIGELPSEWNHLVGYDAPRDDAKLVHFTQGIPCWPETETCEYAQQWKEEALWAMGTVSWNALMGKSVHAKPVLDRLSQSKELSHG